MKTSFFDKLNLHKTLKIHHFYLTCFLSICYIIGYIYIFLFLQIIHRNTTIDLKNFFKTIFGYIIRDGYVDINYLCKLIVLSLLLLIILLLILKIHEYLKHILWQLYMYCRLIYNLNGNKYSKKFDKFCDKLRKYSFNSFLLFLAKKLQQETTTKLKKYFTWGPYLVLIIFLVAECYVYSFVLYYVYYYLFILILYSLWIKISEIITVYSANLCTIMMMEYAYGAPNIIYVNLIPEEEYLFKLLIIHYEKGTDILLDTLISRGLYDIHPIVYYKRFEYISGAPFGIKEKIYYNANIEKYFEVKDLRKIGENYYIDEDIES